MNTKRANNPATICGMVFAVVTALGIAGWSISSAMAPPQRPTRTAAAPKPDRHPGLPSSGAAKTAHVQSESQEAIKPNVGGATGEALAAPDADPFTQIKVSEAPAAATSATLPNQMSQLMSLPALGPQGTTGLTVVRPIPLDIRQAAESHTPELVGTMLGNQPSAVFRDSQRMAVVPEGQKIGDWTVVMVDHGRAVVTNGTRTVRLQVSNSRIGDTVQRGRVLSASSEVKEAPRKRFAEATPDDQSASRFEDEEDGGDALSAFLDAAHLRFLEAPIGNAAGNERQPVDREEPPIQSQAPSRQSDAPDQSPAEKPRKTTGVPPPSGGQ